MIIKQTVRWPLLKSDGNTYGLGNPNPSILGPYGLVNVVAGFGAYPDPGAPSADNMFQKLSLYGRPRKLVAVEIAPDSAINEAWISFGQFSESQRWIISPGSPYYGSSDDDSTEILYVCQNKGIGVISASGSDVAFDATIAGSGGGSTFQWPLRLLLHYDEPPSQFMERRAPYKGRCRFLLGASQTGSFHMCIDGRRRIAITSVAATATASMVVQFREGLVGNTTSTAESSSLITEVFNGAIAAGQERREFFYGTNKMPIQLLRISVTDSAGTGVASNNGHYIQVDSWDE